MSRVERKTHKLKLIGRTWTPWKSITITGEIRNSAPHMEKVQAIWANSKFEVQSYACASPVGGIIQLVVARHGHLEKVDFNDLQRIKTELFGPSSIAIEIYPRGVLDVEMKTRILWVMPDGWQAPCGLEMSSAFGGDL